MAKKTLARRLGLMAAGLIGVLVLAAIGVVLVSHQKRAAHVQVAVADIPIPAGDAAAVARGAYLVTNVMGCPVCHGADFGGRAEVDDPMLGTLWGPNLTGGVGSRVGSFSSADWVRAIRHGVGQDGRRLVLMPSEDFYNFSDSDLGGVVAYLTSRPRVDREDRGVRLGPVGHLLVALGEIEFAYDRIDHDAARPVATPGPTAAWGTVLIGSCTGCHGTGLSGGAIPGAPPDWPPARNLTPDATGLRGWTYDQFVNAFQHGQRPDGTTLSTVMPWKMYAGMDAHDAQALWAYLQTVPAKPAGTR